MTQQFCFKIHKHEKEVILAVCDEEILGQTFREGEMRITVNEAFYGNERIAAEDVRERFKLATIINLVGNEAVALAVAEGLVDPGNILVIGGVKHAQAVTLS